MAKKIDLNFLRWIGIDPPSLEEGVTVEFGNWPPPGPPKPIPSKPSRHVFRTVLSFVLSFLAVLLLCWIFTLRE